MNEEINNALAGIITTFLDVKDFIIEQAPEVIQQLLTYVMFKQGISFLFWVGIIITIWVVRARSSKLFEYDGEADFGSSVLSLIVSVILSLPMFYTFWSFLKVTLAPKLFLLEYASQLVR